MQGCPVLSACHKSSSFFSFRMDDWAVQRNLITFNALMSACDLEEVEGCNKNQDPGLHNDDKNRRSFCKSCVVG